MASRGVTVNVHPVKDSKAKDLPAADLYVFSSPGRAGSPTWRVTRFLKQVKLPSAAKYACAYHRGRPRARQKDRQNAQRGRARQMAAHPAQDERHPARQRPW